MARAPCTAAACRALAHLGLQGHARRFLDQLLVPALNRALALAHVDDGAVRVAEQLDLDVARRRQVLLEVDRRVAEGTLGFGARDQDRVGEVLRVARDAHAAPPAARGRLDDDRVADLLGDAERLLLVAHRTVGARDHRHARRLHRVLGDGLVAHLLDGARRRPDPADAARHHGLGELRVLGQESVAGMDGLRARDFGRGNDAIEIEVALAGEVGPDTDGLIGEANVQRLGVGFAVDGDGLDPHFVARAHHAQRDLAPVGDEDLLEHGA